MAAFSDKVRSTFVRDELAEDPLMAQSGFPLVPEIGILGMPYHQYKTSWMTPHHVLTRLAHYFNVLWLEPAHHWREMPTLRTRQATIDHLMPHLPSSFQIYLPEPWLPDFYRLPKLRRLFLRARVRHGWRRLERRGCTTRVLYLWHPQYEAALTVERLSVSMYHIEDEYSFAPQPPPMDERELRVIRAVDQVLVHSPQLRERKGWINPNTAYIPNGVDFRLYASPVPEPPDIASIPHPRIGYTGNLKSQLDWPLLKALAIRHPDWSFVFVGPRDFLTLQDRAIVDEMAAQPNVFLLGRKSVRELVAYPQHFDVCVMPYVVNDYTQNIYPLKLHEYLASGRPVVGSPIRSLKEFPALILYAQTIDEWCAALTNALAPAASAASAVSARREVAKQHDWSELTYHIAQIICERSNPRLLDRIVRLTIDTPNI